MKEKEKKQINLIDEIIKELNIDPVTQKRIDETMEKQICDITELEAQGYKFNTDKSYSLKLIRDHGYNPIGITTIICEETFIFETEEEASEAHNDLQVIHEVVDGWWYSKIGFEKALETLNEEPKVYWLK